MLTSQNQKPAYIPNVPEPERQEQENKPRTIDWSAVDNDHCYLWLRDNES